MIDRILCVFFSLIGIVVLALMALKAAPVLLMMFGLPAILYWLGWTDRHGNSTNKGYGK